MNQKNIYNYKSYLNFLDNFFVFHKKSKKDFIFELAHELQIPITILKNDFAILQNKYQEEKIIFQLEKNLNKLSFFINNILENSAEFFYQEQKENLNLNKILSEMIESFEIIFQDRDIKIIKNLNKNIYLNCIKKDFIRIINNIISNSVKYISNERKIFINLEKKHNKIFLSIKDTGVGIPRKELRYVFNKYYRSKNNLNIKGNGLGLTICKKIVEKYDGWIFIDSREGKWTEVLLIF